jgi:hypothetical protein
VITDETTRNNYGQILQCGSAAMTDPALTLGYTDPTSSGTGDGTSTGISARSNTSSSVSRQ